MRHIDETGARYDGALRRMSLLYGLGLLVVGIGIGIAVVVLVTVTDWHVGR